MGERAAGGAAGSRNEVELFQQGQVAGTWSGKDIIRNAFAVAGQMGYASALAWLLFAVVFAFVLVQMRIFCSWKVYAE
jgi:ABC-type sugar transport system permease subunit